MSKSAGNLRLVYSKEEVVNGLGIANGTLSTLSARGNEAYGTMSSPSLPSEFYLRLKDGERTLNLTKLVGKLIQQKLPFDAVKVLARDWNQNNQEPLPVDKVDSTCEGIWKTHQRNHPVTESDHSNDFHLPLFNIDEARASRFIGTLPPDRKWLLENFLPFGKVGALVAPGGTGKSQFLLQLGVSVATGIPFLGRLAVPDAGGVLILAAEDDEEELHRRLHNIIVTLHAQYRDKNDLHPLIKENLYVRSMVAEDNLMTQSVNGHKEVQHTSYVSRLNETVKGIPNLKLIIVDPASRFRGGDENAAQDTTRFIEALERIREATGTTVLVAHHTNKWSSNASEQSQHAARGSAAFSDGIRWQMNLLPITKDLSKELDISPERRKHFVAAEIVKNNYGPPADPILLRREEGGFLVAVEVKTMGVERDAALLAEVRRLLRIEMAAGKRYTKTSFEKELGGEHGPLKIGMIRLRALLIAWIAAEKLYLNAKKQLECDAPMASASNSSSGKKANKTKV